MRSSAVCRDALKKILASTQQHFLKLGGKLVLYLEFKIGLGLLIYILISTINPSANLNPAVLITFRKC